MPKLDTKTDKHATKCVICKCAIKHRKFGKAGEGEYTLAVLTLLSMKVSNFRLLSTLSERCARLVCGCR